MGITTEQIQQRIDGLTVDLGPAVQSGNGARFFMLLSLIASNQSYMRPDAVGQAATPGSEFQLPTQGYVYPVEDELYTPAVAERFNEAVHLGRNADFAYLNSYLSALAERPVPRLQPLRMQNSEGVFQAGQLMTAEIETSRQRLVAAA